MRLVVVVALVIAALIAPLGSASAQAECRFVLGFATLRDQVGAAKVGACLENEHFNLENGNAEQRTSGGLLVWRKVDNFTAFTDGGTTWVNGPEGVQSRPNAERFAWEKDPVQSGAGGPRPAASTTPAPAASASPPDPRGAAPAPVAAPPSATAVLPPAPASASVTTPAPVELKGRGRQTTDLFDLRTGVLVVSSMHQGKSNFIVKLVGHAEFR